jgi:hypothetical protein
LLDMNWPLDAIVDGGILAREGINVACATLSWRCQFEENDSFAKPPPAR